VVHLPITVPVFFLVLFSTIPVFADTGSITVVSGKTFTIDYTSTGVKVVDAQVDQSLGEILFTIQVLQNGGTLQVTLPRDLIDSKNSNGSDSDFLAVVDGVLAKPQETKTSTDRILQFTGLTPDETEIDVIGTYLSTSTTVTQSQPVQPTTPAPSPAPQEHNQTSTTPTPIKSTPSPVPTPTAPSTMQTNVTQGTNFVQQNFNNLISKMPYLSSLLPRLSTIDYAVISSIVLVVILVIASAARHRKLARRG
jgi:hypothetical protein